MRLRRASAVTIVLIHIRPSLHPLRHGFASPIVFASENWVRMSRRNNYLVTARKPASVDSNLVNSVVYAIMFP
jgi:hypothetical protein